MSDISELMWDKKYAPKTVDEMVLDDTMKANLNKWIEEGALPQHFVFCGVPGTGKTTLAEILINAFDCDSLKLKADKKAGVDAIRDKVVDFVTTFSFKGFRIVLVDEVDRLSFDAQKALLAVLDGHKDRVRFIFTANHINKLEDALVSRCCHVQFKVLDRKHIGRYACNILEKEGVKYTPQDVGSSLDRYYPDVRALINSLQFDSASGTLLGSSESFDVELEVFELLKQKNVTGISTKLFKVDFVKLYRYIFDHVSEVVGSDRKVIFGALLTVACYMHRDKDTPDREVNFRACCIALISGTVITG